MTTLHRQPAVASRAVSIDAAHHTPGRHTPHTNDQTQAPGPTDPSEITLSPHERDAVTTHLETLTSDDEPLSSRELEVLLALAQSAPGQCRNATIARRLHISTATLRTHLSRLNQKLGTDSKVELVRLVWGSVVADYRLQRQTQSPSQTSPDQGSKSGDDPTQTPSARPHKAGIVSVHQQSWRTT